MSSRRKQKGNKKDKIKQDAHVKEYKKNLRKEEIKKCYDDKKYEKSGEKNQR